MAAISVRVRRNAFGDIARQLPISAAAIVEKRGQEMVQIARDLSRVDTGEMRDGWTWRQTSNASGVMENDVAHVVFNEFGTVRMSAAPMARPAAEQVLPQIIEDFKSLEGLLS